MKITCPVCVGRGWADKKVADVGTKPACDLCHGIGTIDIAALNKQVDQAKARLEKAREHVLEIRNAFNNYDSLKLEEALVDAIIAIG